MAANLPITQRVLQNVGSAMSKRRGLWQYESQVLTIPVVQLADSPLKMIEAAYVGDAVTSVLAEELFELGLGLRGLPITVLGYGQIGSCVASSLRRRAASVGCWD